MGTFEVPQKSWARSVQPFDVFFGYKQTDKESLYNIYIRFSLNFFSFLDKVKGRVFTPQQAQPAPQYPSNQRGGTNPGKVGTVSSAFKTAHEQLIIDQNTKNQRGGREITQVTRRAEVYSSFY